MHNKKPVPCPLPWSTEVQRNKKVNEASDRASSRLSCAQKNRREMAMKLCEPRTRKSHLDGCRSLALCQWPGLLRLKLQAFASSSVYAAACVGHLRDAPHGFHNHHGLFLKQNQRSEIKKNNEPSPNRWPSLIPCSAQFRFAARPNNSTITHSCQLIVIVNSQTYKRASTRKPSSIIREEDVNSAWFFRQSFNILIKLYVYENVLPNLLQQ